VRRCPCCAHGVQVSNDRSAIAMACCHEAVREAACSGQSLRGQGAGGRRRRCDGQEPVGGGVGGEAKPDGGRRSLVGHVAAGGRRCRLLANPTLYSIANIMSTCFHTLQEKDPFSVVAMPYFWRFWPPIKGFPVVIIHQLYA
jgi:hypothetical protein